MFPAFERTSLNGTPRLSATRWGDPRYIRRRQKLVQSGACCNSRSKSRLRCRPEQNAPQSHCAQQTTHRTHNRIPQNRQVPGRLLGHRHAGLWDPRHPRRHPDVHSHDTSARTGNAICLGRESDTSGVETLGKPLIRRQVSNARQVAALAGVDAAAERERAPRSGSPRDSYWVGSALNRR